MKHTKYIIIGILIALAAASPGTAVRAATQQPKGIILVLIDDIGYGDFNALYPSDLRTPQLDTLHRESLSFTDFHVGTTCSPTRGSLMTGRYVNAGGVWHTIAGRSILREQEQTVAEVFKANGWTTGIFGKWHLGDGYPYFPRHRGFDVEVIHGGGGVGQQPDTWNNNYYADVDFDGKPTTPDVYFDHGKPVTANAFCTDFWFQRAQKFMMEAVQNGKPFFCYLPTNAAHGPFNAPHGGKKGFDGLIENLDDNMGRLDTFLRVQGFKDDVLLICTTDNGTTGSERFGGLRGKKGSYYDGGHNVPCFWRWKNGGMAGSPATARDIPSLTTIADFLPTFIDQFGLTRPQGGKPLHGISLHEMLTNPAYVPMNRTWVVDTQRAASLVKWKQAAVLQDVVENGQISHKWRLVRGSEKARFEVYDFLTDREQTMNLATSQTAVIEDLKPVYEDWWKTISVGQQPYTPYVLGIEAETTLVSHDWIGQDMSPWNQVAIKNAADGSRTSSVRFDRSCDYRFELRRWPREDGGAITDRDSSGQGKALTEAVQAELTIDGVGKWTQPVEPGASSVTFNVMVPMGRQTTLTSAFLDNNHRVLAGAYYIYVSQKN